MRTVVESKALWVAAALLVALMWTWRDDGDLIPFVTVYLIHLWDSFTAAMQASGS